MILFVVFFFLEMTVGKIYDRCELARELKFVHKAPPHQVGTWVCIAEHESTYNTSIVGHLNGDGSGDHGIFQISDKYWCSPPGKGYGCGVTCAEFEDDDISDDFICAQTIYKEHKQLSGDGFNAWAVYQPHCKGAKADRYVKDCFGDSKEPKTFTTPQVFAHGFFPTGEVRNQIFTSTKKPEISNFGFPSVVQRNGFTFSTNKPESYISTTTRSPFFSNRFFTSSLNPNFDLFFTPRTTTYRPTLSTTTAFSTTKPTTNNFNFFNPTSSTPSTVSTIRSSVFDFDKFSTTSRNFFNTPTLTTSLYQTSSVSYPPPVFIINGVMWL